MKKLLLVLSLMMIGLSGCYLRAYDDGYHRDRDHHEDNHRDHDHHDGDRDRDHDDHYR